MNKYICKNCGCRIIHTRNVLSRGFKHSYKNKYGNWTYSKTYLNCDKPEVEDVKPKKIHILRYMGNSKVYK
jgi:hypothetical protein